MAVELQQVATLDELKSIIEKEVQDLRSSLEDSHRQKGISERLMSRVADRNDMIRINTLRWVLDIIEKLEKKN